MKTITAALLVLTILLSGCAPAGATARPTPTPRPLRITSLPLPKQYVRGQNYYHLSANALTFGPDGNLWIAAGGLLSGAMDPIDGGAIGRIAPATDKLDWFQPPTLNAQPNDVILGPDGNLWFIENSISPFGIPWGYTIGRITTSGAIQEYPTNSLVPANLDVTWTGGITSGPDGNLWFMLMIADNNVFNGPSTGAVGVMTTTGKLLHTYMLPGDNAEIDASTLGPDGNLWFTVTRLDNAGNPLGSEIGRITTAGIISEYSLPNTHGYPSVMTTGPDGNLWVAVSLPPDFTTSELLRVTPAGKVTRIPLPGMSDNIDGLATGPDGNLWFTHDSYHSDSRTRNSQLARLTMRGQLTEFPLGPSARSPGALTIGPDHALWFIAGDAIDRIG